MIVYNADKRTFVQDVKSNQIAPKILNLIRERGLNAGQDREFASWQNSMNFMRNIVDDSEIDDEVQIAIEYNIPKTSKRVDFIIIGANESGKDNIVIVELKQWAMAEKVDDDMHFSVRTYVANDYRIVCHPSYQAYSYSRFIGNYSSGKMGFALAEECVRRGAQVTLIVGPVSAQLSPIASQRVKRINVESCQNMYDAATQAFPQCDAAILCAAVADFRPEHTADQKIKRQGDELQLRLVANPDIAAQLGRMKREGQVLAGFALETNDEEANAQKKLQKKNLDFIVLNSLRNEGTCFQSDENQISIISATGQQDFDRKSKTGVARDIIDHLVTLLP